jgi:hypothetical protein
MVFPYNGGAGILCVGMKTTLFLWKEKGMNKAHSLSKDLFRRDATMCIPASLRQIVFSSRQHSSTILHALAACLVLVAIHGKCPDAIGAEPSAFAPVAQIPPGCGVIYIYRVPMVISRSMGLVEKMWWRVEVEGQSPCTLNGNCYCAFVCPAGRMKVSHFFQRFSLTSSNPLYDPYRDAYTSIPVDVKAGESRFVKFSFAFGVLNDTPTLMEVPAGKAMTEIANFKLGGVPADELLKEMDDARKRLRRTDRDWETTKAADTIEAYRDFIATHPRTECAAMAAQRLENSGIPVFHAGDDSGGLSQAHEHSRLPPLDNGPTAKRTRIQGRDIVDLIQQRQVEIRVQGNRITNVVLSVRRLTPNPLTVFIPAGTYFATSNKAVQNMISVADRDIEVTSGNWQQVDVPVACTNMLRKIPGKKDALSVQRLSQQSELAMLMPVLARAQVRDAIRQAAIWIVTDNADDKSLYSLKEVFHKEGCVSMGQSSIGTPEIVRAMRIVDAAGIDITKKHVWNSSAYLGSLSNDDEDLRNWLKARAQTTVKSQRSGWPF